VIPLRGRKSQTALVARMSQPCIPHAKVNRSRKCSDIQGCCLCHKITADILKLSKCPVFALYAGSKHVQMREAHSSERSTAQQQARVAHRLAQPGLRALRAGQVDCLCGTKLSNDVGQISSKAGCAAALCPISFLTCSVECSQAQYGD
jgi:hypothetical protein